MVIWTLVVVVAAVAIAHDPDTPDLRSCLANGRDLHDCQLAVHGVDALGAGVIVLLGLLGLFLLLIVWLLTGLRKRNCGSCGQPVRRWRRKCKNCGYDMRRRPPLVASPAPG
jgi:hypothetical protein